MKTKKPMISMVSIFKYQFSKFILTTFVVALCLAQNLYANSSDDSSERGYDSIIRELSSSVSTKQSSTHSDPFDDVRFHLGVGMVTSRLALDLPSKYAQSKSLKGVEAVLGIDMFSPYWSTQGAVRTFNPEPFSGGEISLKEFDLALVYNFNPYQTITFTIGAGLSARYLDFTGNITGSKMKNNTTPATIISAGIVANISKAIALSVEASLHEPLSHETPDNGSIDGSFKINGNF
ncbi:MAG: hypothetical protein ABL927_10105 [Bdellovibrionales bacterium]